MATINPKPAAGLFGGALTTVGLGLITRHTGYDPSVEEIAGITTLVSFAVAWLVPESLWDRLAPNVEVDALPVDAHEGAEQ
jgi:hypothetical protein